METSTLQKKKTSINKGKLKKTIKNVLCRPDPVFWPAVSDSEGQILAIALSKHKVDIPEYKKLHWKELKLLPKEERPKPPKIKKVDGLLFGISECSNAIRSGECSAIIIEATVNPQMIVQPLLESCETAQVPAVCFNGLRTITSTSFGIATSCLGIKNNYLPEISEKILKLAKVRPPKEKRKTENIGMTEIITTKEIAMDTQECSIPCPYLFRTHKQSRVFVPPLSGTLNNVTKDFIGQDFIEFSDKSDKEANRKSYMKMMVKRISNNPNRVKVK